jgi:hypothetical protein
MIPELRIAVTTGVTVLPDGRVNYQNIQNANVPRFPLVLDFKLLVYVRHDMDDVGDRMVEIWTEEDGERISLAKLEITFNGAVRVRRPIPGEDETGSMHHLLDLKFQVERPQVVALIATMGDIEARTEVSVTGPKT